ncbi:sulfite exporter TauE/SafE family protein [Sulfurimonas sp. SAG-AH-194-I05]|nr:sulfite exporter TauE/SafE family protein [Sulfurimonas sp. SAG-AH-194-I05]MDF1874132.1 sulfite exporter TauE/SafE family protein [Sulfurimonas sp. SAG-AH-194-I05]
MENIELIAIISFAFLGSIGHCIGMCGGFIITYTTLKIKPEQSKLSQGTYHLLYNFGRITTYTLLGALFGYFGSLWDVTPLTRAVLFFIAGFLMIAMGLSFAGKLRFLTFIEYSISEKQWYKAIFVSQITSVSLKSFFILGLLNGLLPCGLIYTMLITSITTESAFLGAFVMFVFGIFTIPALFSFAFIVGLFSQNRFRQTMIQLAAVTIILYGGWTLFKAYEQYTMYSTKTIDTKSCCSSTKIHNIE